METNEIVEKLINEARITFNKREPKYNQFVIVAGGGGCFDSETLVKTENGYKRICDISKPDKVYTLNEITNEEELKRVNDIYVFDSSDKKLLELKFVNGETVICTEDHEFLINDYWIKVKDIKDVVISRKVINDIRKVYDLSIEDNHNYIITKSDMIVHNSGKGFVIDKLLGVKGKILDVDALKTMALKSVYIKNSFKEKYKIDISELELKNPKNTSLLHDLISQSKLDKAQLQILTNTINPNNQHKPNIIIDNTLSNLPKFSSLCFNAQQMGYDKKDIHLVWVLNKLSIALKQNKERKRVVPEDILISTHLGANLTVKEIIKYFDETSKENMDGDIWIVFNAADEDTSLKKSKLGGSYLEKATYIKVKEAGKPIKSLSEFSDEILKKLESYHKI